ncbi:MAG TPA: hypothetical protein VEJ63_24310 [Planctomycetota bacterium]|nr:hypothetical protein [Planctomycetota bacterium]
MSEPIKFPKRPVLARVTLFGGKRVTGEFFAEQATPTHDSPETLPELLNHEGRAFVPFHTGQDLLLLHRRSIRLVEFDSPELQELFKKPGKDLHEIKIVLRAELNELSLQGLCYTGDLHPETRRPVDLLNHADPFLLFYSTGSLMLINKNSISHAAVV